MDGVLIDSERHWQAIEGAWLRSVIPGWLDEHQKECIGLSMSGLYEMLQLKYGLSMTLESFRLAYTALAESIYQKNADLMPHCREFMDAARSAGVKLAVVSSSPKPWIQIIVNRFNISGYFCKLVSADDVGGVGKPDPAVYLHAAEQLSESPAHCAAIEDSENGILSAHRAGMRCIGFRNGWNDTASMDLADQIMHGFSAAALHSILIQPASLSLYC
jgi:HAD superfamily hydrolase (TIGR01509 family)